MCVYIGGICKYICTSVCVNVYMKHMSPPRATLFVIYTYASWYVRPWALYICLRIYDLCYPHRIARSIGPGNTLSSTHSHTHTHTHTYTHTNTYTHTQTNTHIHTYIYIHIHIRKQIHTSSIHFYIHLFWNNSFFVAWKETINIYNVLIRNAMLLRRISTISILEFPRNLSN